MSNFKSVAWYVAGIFATSAGVSVSQNYAFKKGWMDAYTHRQHQAFIFPVALAWPLTLPALGIIHVNGAIVKFISKDN